MADRTEQYLIAYDKQGNEVARGNKGEDTIVINNLAPATHYDEGDYKVAWATDTGVSAKVNLPAFDTKDRVMESFKVLSDVIGVHGDVITVAVTDINPSDTTNRDIEVDSDNENIVTVKPNKEAGKFDLTLNGVGQANLSWKSADGGAKALTKVTATNKLLDGFSVVPYQVNDEAGKQTTVEVTDFQPADPDLVDITVSSEDEKIAKVSEGNDKNSYVIDLLSEGQTQISFVDRPSGTTFELPVMVTAKSEPQSETKSESASANQPASASASASESASASTSASTSASQPASASQFASQPASASTGASQSASASESASASQSATSTSQADTNN